MGEDLTKSPLPLIIFMGFNHIRLLGVGATVTHYTNGRRRFCMRVRVYKDKDGVLSAFIEASPGKGRAPVLLQGVTPQNVTAQVGPVVAAMRRPKDAPKA